MVSYSRVFHVKYCFRIALSSGNISTVHTILLDYQKSTKISLVPGHCTLYPMCKTGVLSLLLLDNNNIIVWICFCVIQEYIPRAMTILDETSNIFLYHTQTLKAIQYDIFILETIEGLWSTTNKGVCHERCDRCSNTFTLRVF